MHPFPKQARVCFIGDSITHNNGYVSRIAAYYKKNLPELQVRFWNNGVSGGSLRTVDLFFADDVQPVHPTHAVLMLGVNDSDRNALTASEPERSRRLNAAFETYCHRLDHLCDVLYGQNIQAILCTPAPYAEFQQTAQDSLPGGHALILRYAEQVRHVSRERELPLVDYHARLSELYLDEVLYGDDHVHPNDFGHYRMAECFLRAQGLEIAPYAPLAELRASAGLTEWAANVSILRNIFATEWLFISDYALPLKEKMAQIAKLSAGNTIEWKASMFHDYLTYKPQQAELAAKIDRQMEDFYR